MTKQELTVKGIQYEKETYWCNKCKRFHKYLHAKKPSPTHLEHFCYLGRFKHQFSQTELFKLDFKKNGIKKLKRENK